MCSLFCILNVKKISANTFSLIHSNTIPTIVCSIWMSELHEQLGGRRWRYIHHSTTPTQLHNTQYTKHIYRAGDTGHCTIVGDAATLISTTYCWVIQTKTLGSIRWLDTLKFQIMPTWRNGACRHTLTCR